MDAVDIYARISDDREGQRKGVDRQLPDCRAYCERNGLAVADEYVDNDLTASRKRGKRPPRPAFAQLFQRVKDGTTTTIVVWHLDRLYRDARELEDLIDLVEVTQVRIRTVSGGDFDLNVSDGRAMARVVVAFNMKESEDKSRRLRRKHLELAEEGRRHGGGSRHFGYLPDHSNIDADEAALVRQAARRVLAGESIRSICADWTAKGVPTVNGGAWSQTSLKRTLTAASIAGLREHRGIIRPGTWPAILDETTWRRLRVILLDPDRRKNLAARRYLLSGFLVCGRCEARMVARPKADKRRAYVCASGPGFSGCGKMGVLAEPLEDVIVRLLFRRLDSPATLRAIARRHDDSDEQLLAELAADEAALEQIAHDRYVERIISPGQFVAASQALEAKVAATKRRLRRKDADALAEQWVGNGGMLAETWAAQPIDWQRAVLGAFVESVTIGPAIRGLNRFDRDRIRPKRGGGILWRY